MYFADNQNEEAARVRNDNLVLQRQENTPTALKRLNYFGKFYSSYLWTFEDFSNFCLEDSVDMRSSEITFGSCKWELGLNLKRRRDGDDFVILISLNKETCNISKITVKWRMSFVDKNGCKQFIKEDEIQNSTGLYQDVYAIGRNLLFSTSLQDLLFNDCLTICFELVSRDMFSCQHTWERDLGREWLDTPPCLSYLSNDLLRMLDQGDLSDVVLNVKGKEFKAHKMILSARSTVFSAMFTHDMKERKEGKVNIEDINASDMHNLLIYIYSGVMPDITTSRLLNLYIAADKYDISSLKKRCRELIKSRLDEDNFLDVLKLADKYSDEELLSSVKSFLIFKDDILSSKKWKNYCAENTAIANEVFDDFITTFL